MSVYTQEEEYLYKLEPQNPEFYQLSFYRYSDDCIDIINVVNQGIDSYLTGFTNSLFYFVYNRLYCEICPSELNILIRRLVELNSENSENLADSILHAYFGYKF